jgi:hypothetical protein
VTSQSENDLEAAPAPQSVAPLTDSPWFWLYLFSIAALAGLILIGPKYYARQSQVERQYQGKVRAAQAAAGAEPTKELSRPEATQTSLTPLIILFAAIWICAWPLVWWTLRKRVAAPQPSIES